MAQATSVLYRLLCNLIRQKNTKMAFSRLLNWNAKKTILFNFSSKNIQTSFDVANQSFDV